MFSRKISVSEILSDDSTELVDQWLEEPIKAYLRALSTSVHVRDKFDLLVYDERNSGFSSHWETGRPAWLGSRITKTKRPFKSGKDVSKEIYEMLCDAMDHPDHKNLFSIIEPDGKVVKLRRDHEGLVESRKRTLRFTSEVLRLKIYPDYKTYKSEKRFKETNKGRAYSDLDFSTTQVFRMPGSVVFGFANYHLTDGLKAAFQRYATKVQSKQKGSDYEEMHYPPAEDAVACFDHFGSEISKHDQRDQYNFSLFWETIEKFFDYIHQYDIAFTDETNFSKLDLLNAYKLLVSAAHEPKPLQEVERALNIVIQSIDNQSELTDNQMMLGVRWDLFGEALLETFCGNIEHEKITKLLHQCADETFKKNPLAKHISFEILRRMHWNPRDWITPKLIRDDDKAVKKRRMSSRKIVNLSKEGRIDLEQTVKTLLELVTSPQDRWDALWVAIDIAKKAKNSDPKLAAIINAKLVLLTSSAKVTGKSRFPDSDEWYRRICGGDNEKPRRLSVYLHKQNRKSIRNIFLKNAKRLATISEIARQIDLSTTDTHQVLVNRTMSDADPAIAVAIDELSTRQSYTGNELVDFLREAKELSPTQLDEASILLEQLRESLRSQPNGAQVRQVNPDLEKGQTLPGF